MTIQRMIDFAMRHDVAGAYVSDDNGLTVVSWAVDMSGKTWAIVETVYSFGELRALLGY